MQILKIILSVALCVTGAIRTVADSADQQKAGVADEVWPAAEFPITGMTAAELVVCLNQIAEQLGPDAKILSLVFWGPAKVSITTGVRESSTLGRGETAIFERKDHKWIKTQRKLWTNNPIGSTNGL